jgi:hypothetical protein
MSTSKLVLLALLAGVGPMSAQSPDALGTGSQGSVKLATGEATGISSLSVTSAASPADEAARLKTAYAALVAQAKKLPRERYIAGLKLLMDQSTRSGKLDLAFGARDLLKMAEDPGGEVSPSSDPKTLPELTALQKKFNQECDTATKSIREKYAASVQTLLHAAMQKGDLATVEDLQSQTEGKTAESILFGTWRWNWPGGTVLRTFHPGGRVTSPDEPGKTATWVIKNNAVVMTHATGTDTIPLPLDPKGTTGHSTNGPPFTITKVR